MESGVKCPNINVGRLLPEVSASGALGNRLHIHEQENDGPSLPAHISRKPMEIGKIPRGRDVKTGFSGSE